MGSYIMALDGNSIMHRAFHALPSLSDNKGRYTNAVYGFLGMMFKAIEDYKPDAVVVAFDMHGKTFRHAMYDEYKGTRAATPDELVPQFGLIRDVLRAMGIPYLEFQGYEADDILGTISVEASKQGIRSILVSGDKDALQLVNADTDVLMMRKGISDVVLYSPDGILERYGVTPEQLKDVKGLMGDSSDNIPGVPGIGEKTALKLVQQFRSLEGVLANIKDAGGAKLQEKLTEHADIARLSKELATIKKNVPLEHDLAEFDFTWQSVYGAEDILKDLNMKSLITRLDKKAGKKPADAPKAKVTIPSKPVGETAKTAADPFELYNISDTVELQKHMADMKDAERIAAIIGDNISIACLPSRKQYDIHINATLLDDGIDITEAMQSVSTLLALDKPKTVFDAKSLMHMLEPFGASICNLSFDVVIAAYLLEPRKADYNLSYLSEKYLSGGQSGANILFALQDAMETKIEALEMQKLFREIELPLIEVLYGMENQGFCIDEKVLEELSEKYSDIIKSMSDSIYAHAGKPFNINSVKQLGEVLFDDLKLPVIKKTKTGYSTDISVLEKLSGEHEIIGELIKYRKIFKLKSTYIDGLLDLSKNGRIYTSFQQTVASTGRISSTEPNLQNIPIRTEEGKEIRRAFVPSGESNTIVAADYSQIELRVLAHIAKDQVMQDAFNKNQDVHSRTASEVFSVPLEAVTASQRSAAKAVNFGIVYGISDFGLARNLNIPVKTASEYIKNYLSKYSGIRQYMQDIVEQARENGYVSTLMGRRLYIDELFSSNFNVRSFGERIALNMPIQGTAADMIKMAMIAIYKGLEEKGLKTKLILQVHDELILDARRDELDAVEPLLKSCMENVLPMDVPIVADVYHGNNWLEAK